MATLQSWKPKLIAKMKAERIRNLSDTELTRVFAGCVAENLCIKYAKELIEIDELKLYECLPTIWEEDGTNGPRLIC